MNIIDKLIGRLHRVFSKDPLNEPIITIEFEGEASLSFSNHVLRTESLLASTDSDNYQNLDIDLRDLTVSDLVDAINSYNGFTATLDNSSYADDLAVGIFQVEYQDLMVDNILYYPSSKLYTEMNVASLVLEEQKERVEDLEKQMYAHTATGRWLDYWGKRYFGNARDENESDTDYAARIIYEAIRATQNNIALENILQDSIGMTASIVDAWGVRDQLKTEAERKAAAGHFMLDMEIPSDLTAEKSAALVAKSKRIIREYKAAGTDFLSAALCITNSPTEKVSLASAYSMDIFAALSEIHEDGPIRYGAGWRYGTPGLYYGTNSAIKEQVVVNLVLVEDDSISQQELCGG